MRMQHINSGIKRILFFLLFLLSFYWLFWSVRYIFSDVLPRISHTFFLSLLVLGIVSGITFYKSLKPLAIKSCKLLYTYRYFVIGILFIGQFVISLFAQALAKGDAAVLYTVATNIPVNREDILKYFSLNPNNFFILVVFKIINSIVSSKNLILAVSLLNAAAIDAGILLLTSLAKHLRGEKLSQIIFIEALFLIGLQPQFLYFYTDPFTFFLTSLLCYLAIIKSSSKKIYPWFFIGIIFSIASQIRVPVFIYLFAFIFAIVYQFIFSSKQVALKPVFVKGLLLTSGIAIVTLGVQYYAHHQNFTEYDKKYSRSLMYFVDLGLTDTGANHSALPPQILSPGYNGKFKTKTELAPEIKKDVQTRISEYGAFGMLKHQSTKFKLFVEDGSLGWTIESVLDENNIVNTQFTDSILGHKIRNIVYTSGQYYPEYALYMQITWSIVVFGLVSYFRKYKKILSYELVLQLTLLGGILFLSIFEAGRSRYLIQFLPVIIILSSIGFLNYFKDRQNSKQQ